MAPAYITVLFIPETSYQTRATSVCNLILSVERQPDQPKRGLPTNLTAVWVSTRDSATQPVRRNTWNHTPCGGVNANQVYREIRGCRNTIIYPRFACVIVLLYAAGVRVDIQSQQSGGARRGGRGTPQVSGRGCTSGPARSSARRSPAYSHCCSRKGAVQVRASPLLRSIAVFLYKSGASAVSHVPLLKNKRYNVTRTAVPIFRKRTMSCNTCLYFKNTCRMLVAQAWAAVYSVGARVDTLRYGKLIRTAVKTRRRKRSRSKRSGPVVHAPSLVPNQADFIVLARCSGQYITMCHFFKMQTLLVSQRVHVADKQYTRWVFSRHRAWGSSAQRGRRRRAREGPLCACR